MHQKPRFETENIKIHNFLYYQYKICIFLKALSPSSFKDQPLQTFLLQRSMQAVECSSTHRPKLIFQHTTFGRSLLKTSTSILLVPFTLRVHVPNVCRYLCHPIILHVRSCNISVWLLKLYLCKISFNGILYILQSCLQYCIFLIHSLMPTLSYYHCTVKPY